MRAARVIARQLSRFGSAVTIRSADGGQRAVRALVLPVRSKSRQAMARSEGQTGLLGPEQYVFLGSADCGLAVGETAAADGVDYLVRRAERLCVGEAVYCWGLLIRDGGDAEWSN